MTVGVDCVVGRLKKSDIQNALLTVESKYLKELFMTLLEIAVEEHLEFLIKTTKPIVSTQVR